MTMNRLSRIALALTGLFVTTSCTTVSGPESPKLPARAGTVEPALIVRNSGGVDAEGMYRIGRYFQGQQNFADALAYYGRAIAMNPAHAEAHNAAGTVHSIQGRADEAERSFRAAIAVAPASSHLHANLGFHLLMAGQPVAAATALREAIRLSPANALAWAHLGAAERQIAALPVEQPQVRAASVASPVESAGAGLPAQMLSTPAPAQVAPVRVGNADVPVTIPTDASPATSAPVAAPTHVSPATSAPVAAPTHVSPATDGPVAVVPMPLPALTNAVSALAAAPSFQPGRATIAEAQPTEVPLSRLIAVAPNVFELRPARTGGAEPARSEPAAQQLAVAQISVATELRPVRLEISNGNGVTALARSVGAYLRTLGAAHPRLTNQRPFGQRHTEIQYVEGMQIHAVELRNALDTPANLVRKARLERGIEVRLVLGADFHELEAVAQLRRENVRPVLASRSGNRL
jgi:tetratricopeptide (TPR) repeat protein